MKITPEVHERIRTVYEAGTGNGEVTALARELGLRVAVVSRHAQRQGWVSPRGPGVQNKKALEMRELASLHCEHFRACLDIASKKNVSMKCHTCDRMKFERDTWQKEVSLANISRSGDGYQSVKLEETPCPIGGGMHVGHKDCKQGREVEVMEKTKDERSTSNVEHRTPACHSEAQAGRSNEKKPSTISIEDLPGPKSKGELETRVCSQADCEFGGEPQPIDNFRRNPRYPEKRFKKCNSCVSKRMQVGQQRRQERLREEKQKGERLKKLKDERPTSNVQHPTSNEKPAAVPGDTLQPGTELPPAPSDLKTYQYYPPDLLETLLDELPDVRDKIIEIAKDQERTPEAQVRYLLKTDYRICGTENKQ